MNTTTLKALHTNIWKAIAVWTVDKIVDPRDAAEAIEGAIKKYTDQAIKESRSADAVVLRQWQTPDGAWHNFMNADHESNAIANGGWTIRELCVKSV